jgi:hypothetical protein
MGRFYSPEGNYEVWDEKPDGHYTLEEWKALHPDPEPPKPTVEEKLAQLESDYRNQKQELINQYTDDMLHGDEEAMAEEKAAMEELDSWFDEEYAKIEEEEE